MITTILILLSIAVMHFIYESIILPSIRLSLRFKLFALRDQLRELLMRDADAGEVFRIQQSAINNSIKMLSRADPATLARFEQQLRDDEAMRNRVERRTKLVDEYASEEFQIIVKETRHAFRSAFVANMGAWFIYIVPIAVVFLCLDHIKSVARKFLSVPEGELGKVFEMDAAFA